jgi:serine/threonine-protein kinase
MVDRTDPNLAPVSPGDVLAGKYRVEGVLASGGMGVVVVATHLQLGQRCAMKFLLPEALQQRAALERFAREARAAAMLKSDNVVRVIDVATLENGAPYMVMELLEGEDLGALIARRGPLPPAEAVEYVIQACDAIAEAHSLGIVHRDLKPKNLFLTRRRNGAPLVKVLDFGISKVDRPGADHSLTRTSEVMGSPNYMAPEQIRSSRSVDARTDVWALGVILYELVTGHVPFEAETVPQLCAMVLEQTPPSVASLRQGIPAEVVAAIERCLAKEPGARYPDVAHLVRALSPGAPVPGQITLTSGPNLQALSSEGVVSPHAVTVAQVAQYATSTTFGKSRIETKKRSPAGPIAAVLLLVGGVAVAGVVGWQRLHPRAPGAQGAPPTASTELAAGGAIAIPPATATASSAGTVVLEPVPPPPAPPPPLHAPPIHPWAGPTPVGGPATAGSAGTHASPPATASASKSGTPPHPPPSPDDLLPDERK